MLLRRAMGRFATGVTVIVAEIDGTLRAMTAHAVTALSLQPPLVIACVKRTGYMGRLGAARSFSINILSQSQRDLSVYFSGARRATPARCTFVNWAGMMRLDGCIAAVGCAVEEVHKGGDHWIVVGRVTALHVPPSAQLPLVHLGGSHETIAPPGKRRRTPDPAAEPMMVRPPS